MGTLPSRPGGTDRRQHLIALRMTVLDGCLLVIGQSLQGLAAAETRVAQVDPHRLVELAAYHYH